MSNTVGHHLHGQGDRGAIVLHDWMGDASEWDQAAPYFNTESHTYAFMDVRGYGRSRDLAGQHDVAEIAADIVALADHLGWARFDVIGHSMTGMAAQRALLDDVSNPESRIGRAVLVSPVTATGYPADDDTKQFLWSTIDDAEVAAQGFSALTGGKLDAPWCAARTERFNEIADKAAVKDYYRMWLDTDFSAELAAASPATPVLVVGGRNDLPGFDEDTYRATIGEWFPNATFAFVTDAGHYAMQETPILLAALVNAHLGQDG